MQQTALPELLLDIIYIGGRDQSPAEITASYTAACAMVTQHLKARPKKSAETTPSDDTPYPFVLSLAGIDLECLHSYADCARYLRRHPTIAKALRPTCLLIHAIPPGILAEDALTIICRNRNSLAASTQIDLALTLPPIPHAIPPLGYRLLILTQLNIGWFYIDSLVTFMRSNNIPGTPELRGTHIYGFEQRASLIRMYESFYGRNDKTLRPDAMKAPSKVVTKTKPARESSTSSVMPASAKPPTTRVSNYTSHQLPASSDTSASLTTTISTALASSSTALTLPTIPVTDSSTVLHHGRTVDIVDLVQQLVTEQLAPLRTQFNDQATKHDPLQQTLFVQHIHDQEQLFLRVKAEFKKGQRDLHQLRKERAKYQDHTQEAQDLDGYVLQDQKDLDIQLGNLKHIYAETIQEARNHNVRLMTLTGEETQDF